MRTRRTGVSWLALVCPLIVCPVGTKNVHLRLVVTHEGQDNIGSYHHDELHAPLTGRVTDLHEVGLANQFDRMYGGARDAFQNGAVRTHNAILVRALYRTKLPVAATARFRKISMAPPGATLRQIAKRTNTKTDTTL